MTVHALYIYECLLFFVKNRSSFELETQTSNNTRTMIVNYPLHRLEITENPVHVFENLQ